VAPRRPAAAPHGSAALVAGQAHVSDGRLTGDRLQAIYDGSMRPRLAAGDLAGAIQAGLDDVASALRQPAGPPGPLATIGTPINVLGVLVLFAALLLAGSARGRTRRTRPSLQVPRADLPAAVVGAIAGGRPATFQAAAIVLDLARRGAVAIEAGPDQEPRVRIVDPTRGGIAADRLVLRALQASAGPDGTVAPTAMPYIEDLWPALRAALVEDLVRTGLYGRPSTSSVARWAGVGVLIAGVVAAILALAFDAVGLVGVALLGAAGGLTLLARRWLPETTSRGEAAARGWRALRAGLMRARPGRVPPAVLDAALPYAIAMGALDAVDRQVSAGYRPALLSAAEAAGTERALNAAMLRSRLPNWAGDQDSQPGYADWMDDRGTDASPGATVSTSDGAADGSASGGGSF
jgi:uncharacterized membrane protein YgcG